MIVCRWRRESDALDRVTKKHATNEIRQTWSWELVAPIEEAKEITAAIKTGTVDSLYGELKLLAIGGDNEGRCQHRRGA